MNRFIPYVLLITGICLSITAVFVTAQDTLDLPEPSEYIGSRECRDCHRSISSTHENTVHAFTMVEIEEDLEEDENPIVADFSVGEDIRTVTLPGEDTERAFALEDVAFNLGAGRNVQAFIYESEEEVFYVLPAEWDVNTGEWKRLELAESWPDEAYEFGKNCAGCHTVGLDTESYEWEEEGVNCEACHGPGLDHVELVDDAGRDIDEEERVEIYASINLAVDSQVCGQCHVRGLAEDGIHPYPVGYYPGLIELTDVYNPVSTDDETHWWSTGHAKLPNMQFNEWLTSAHGNSLSDARESGDFKVECLTCHSAAQNVIDLRLNNEELDPESINELIILEEHSYGITCASCHNPHKETEDEEVALPALLSEEPYTLCVSCHRDNDVTENVHHPVQQVFEGLPIVENIEVAPSPHFTAENGPSCSTCHMPNISTYNGERQSHTFEIIAPGAAIDIEELEDTCSECHEQSPAELQTLIDELQNGTRARIEVARENLSDETAEWVTIALDVVDNEGSYGIHNYSYTSALLGSVETELGLGESATLTSEEVAAEIADALPDVEVEETQPIPNVQNPTGGLTTPSIVLLAIALLIIAGSAFAFFRGGDNETKS